MTLAPETAETSETVFTVGLDFGTQSARAVVLDAANGDVVAEAAHPYARGESGVIGDQWDPNVARQDPRDYVEALEATLAGVMVRLREDGRLDNGRVVGVGVATTGSTPLPLDGRGAPLAFDPRFEADPAALAWLWKDHTSHAEAAEITSLIPERGLPYLEFVGGTYSSEWFWAKILRCSRVAPEVFAAAASWCELSDLVPALATGTGLEMSRGATAAGHKALYARRWGGLPDEAFLSELSPGLGALRGRLYDDVQCSSEAAGTLEPGLAARVGLDASVKVAVGTFDAHAGAVAGGVVPGRLVKIMGTSTCDCTVLSDDVIRPIPGVCGVVEDSVIPGRIGVEAGQSAVGDLFEWFVDRALAGSGRSHADLSKEAALLAPGQSGLLALDWNNGNRTILVDPLLSGLLLGQTLATTAAEIYRALVEATAFGARIILEQIERSSTPIEDVVVSGGIAQNSFAMQLYADVLGRPIRLVRFANASAAGAAIFAAVAAGVYPSTEAAQEAMVGSTPIAFRPHPDAVRVYERLYAQYRLLHDAFGRDESARLGHVMKELIDIRGGIAS